MSALNPLNTIRCERCEGTGTLENDGVESACPVCDGDPLITYPVVAEYARQIDINRKRILTVEFALWCYYAKHQEDKFCDCRTCQITRRILHLQNEDIRSPEQRKAEALDWIGNDAHQTELDTRMPRNVAEMRAGIL